MGCVLAETEDPRRLARMQGPPLHTGRPRPRRPVPRVSRPVLRGVVDKYYVNGQAVRESTDTEKETEAKRALKVHEGRAATGQPMLPRVDRIRYTEAAKDLRRHYQTTGSRDLEEAEYRLTHLDTFFGPYRLTRIGPAEATAYVQERQAAKASNGTINRELALLNRMLRLAYENGKLLRLPIIRQFEEACAAVRILRAGQIRGRPAPVAR